MPIFRWIAWWFQPFLPNNKPISYWRPNNHLQNEVCLEIYHTECDWNRDSRKRKRERAYMCKCSYINVSRIRAAKEKPKERESSLTDTNWCEKRSKDKLTTNIGERSAKMILQFSLSFRTKLKIINNKWQFF